MKIYVANKKLDEIKEGQMVYIRPMVTPKNTIIYEIRLPNQSNFRAESRYKMEIDRDTLEKCFTHVA